MTPLISSSVLPEPSQQDADEITPLLPNSGPFDEETVVLRRVTGPIPFSIFLILIMECCERAAYYGLSGPLQNYIQNRRGDPMHRGLGLGQANATRINLAFNVLCYLSPIPGAILADQYFGRYRVIKYSSGLYVLGLALLFITSLPISRDHDLGLPGLLGAFVLIGLGTGGIKSTLPALIADQFPKHRPLPVTVDEALRGKCVSKESVFVDREMSAARAFLFFYAAAQVGSFSSLMTTTLEMHKGFPYAFFLPLPIFASGLLIFLAMNGSLVTFPPQGSTVLQSVKDLLTLRGKSSATNDLGTGDDIYSALSTCKIFLFFPFYFVCHLQMFTNLISQAGSMDAHGLPNDLLISINPLTVIIFAPTLDMALYPILQRYNIRPRPIARITFGFICMSAAMAYAACLQSSIYKSPPCYSYPRHEDCFAGNVPNQIHIAAQIPVYVLGGISEVFTLSTGMEWAAMRAPASMRSLVVAVFASTFAGGAGLAMVISPLAKDPLLVRMYAVLSGVVGAAGATFWVLFRNKEEIGGKLDI